MTTAAPTKTYRHHYVCGRGHQHEHRTVEPRPTQPTRRCRKCQHEAVYRYTNFEGDAKRVSRAHYAMTGSGVTVPAGFVPAAGQAVDLGKPAYAESARAGQPNAWGRTPAPIPHHLRQGRRSWIVGTPEQELKHALNLIDEFMSAPKGMTLADYNQFCNDALPFMHAHGRQRGRSRFE